MARGWESKAVDDQIAAAEVARSRRPDEAPDAATRARRARLDTLRLNRARTLQSLQAACDRRYRALLEQTLAHLDAELASMED